MEFEFAAFADESAADLKGQIDALRRNGFSCLELRSLDGKNVTTLTPEEGRAIADRLRAEGLRVRSVGSPIGKIPVDGDFAAHKELLRHTLELGNVLGAQQLRLFSFYMPKGEDPAAYRQKVIDRVAVMTELTLAAGLEPCHENEKGIYGDVASRCLELHLAIPDLRAVFDPANFVQCGQDTLEAWASLHPYVSCMHIKDALSDGTVVPAGQGEGALPQLLRAYGRQGGALLSLEPHLTEFVGLRALERAGEESGIGALGFESGSQAFDHAAKSLKKLLEDM